MLAAFTSREASASDGARYSLGFRAIADAWLRSLDGPLSRASSPGVEHSRRTAPQSPGIPADATSRHAAKGVWSQHGADLRQDQRLLILGQRASIANQRVP